MVAIFTKMLCAKQKNNRISDRSECLFMSHNLCRCTSMQLNIHILSSLVVTFKWWRSFIELCVLFESQRSGREASALQQLRVACSVVMFPLGLSNPSNLNSNQVTKCCDHFVLFSRTAMLVVLKIHR